MTPFFEGKQRFFIWQSMFLLCLICGADGAKNGFRGGSKSYEIHVEASSVGTNLHYQLPEAKVKAAGKAKQSWMVDNDNAEMTAINSPVLALVSVKHPKFSAKGEWPGYKFNFKVPKDSGEGGAKKDFVLAKDDNRQTASSFLKSSGIAGSAVAESGFEPSSAEEEVKLSDNLPIGETRQVKGVTENTGHSDIRNPRESADESEKLEHAHKSFSLQEFSGLLLPLKKLKNLRLKDPFVRAKMGTIVAHAKKVVTEAKTVLKDAASFVSNVKTLVDSGKVDLGGVAENVEKTVEDVGSGEMGLLKEGIAVGEEFTGMPNLDSQTRKDVLQKSKLGSSKTTKAEEGSGTLHDELVATNASKPKDEAEKSSTNDHRNKRRVKSRRETGNIRNRRESRIAGQTRELEGLEGFLSSIDDLKKLLGLPKK